LDERRPLNPDGHVIVHNVSGSVDVSTWSKSEVYLTGEVGPDVEKVDISGDPAELVISVKLPLHSHSGSDANLKIYVPEKAGVEVHSVSADVSINGSRGTVNANTVSGDIRLDVGSPDVTVRTVSGDLTLHAPSENTAVNSVSGDLHLIGPQGSLRAETVSGNLELDGGRFADLKLKSVSGDMRLDVTLAEKAQITGDTLSGGITLAVPADVSGNAVLKSFSGDTECDLSSVQPVSRGNRHEYVWGTGQGVQVELSSFSGDIRVEKQQPRAAQTPPPFVGKDPR